MRFLFCSLSSSGFLFPALGIAEQLRGRGHEVAFVTDVGASQTVARVGFRRLPRGKEDGPSFQVQHWGVALSVAIQAKHIEYALGQFPADVLVGQPMTLGPLIVAERRGLPTGVIGLAPYLWPYTSDPIAAADAQVPEAVALRAWRYADGLRIYNDARRLFGLAPTEPPPDENPFLGDLYLMQSGPRLADPAGRLPARVRLVGACSWEPPGEPDEELVAWLDRAIEQRRPIVYVQQARSFDAPRFWPRFVRAAAGLDASVVASLARMDGEVGDVPANVLVRQHVSQSRVLPEAGVAVGSGTTTAVLGALVHGVPSVLLPAGGEQIDLAERCVEAGVAISVSPDSDAATIGRAIEHMLADREMAARAAAVGEELVGIGGSERAARLLEGLGRSSLGVGTGEGEAGRMRAGRGVQRAT